jgi:hypothetical protein
LARTPLFATIQEAALNGAVESAERVVFDEILPDLR